MVDKIRAIIIDDDPEGRGDIRDLLALEPDVDLIAEAESAEKGLELLLAKKPDLVFLDIMFEIGEMQGMEVAARLRNIEHPPYFVFITAAPEKNALKGYMYQPAHFLRKPIEDAHFVEALNRVREAISQSPRCPRLAIKCRGPDGARMTAFAKIMEILYIGSRMLEDKKGQVKSTIDVYLANGEMLADVDGTLDGFEEQLSGRIFFRIERRYLVNLVYARGIVARPSGNDHDLQLEGCDQKIPIGRDKLF